MADVAPKVVNVTGPDGVIYDIPDGSVPEAVRRGGKVTTQAELQEFRHGGIAGALGTGTLAAVDTITRGGGTAALAEGGVIAGGQEGRLAVEDRIRQLKQTNPIANTLGAVAPLALAPEVGGEALAGRAFAGEGALSGFARWAAPHAARGIVETAALEGAQGVSEDILDHSLSAESFYVHSMKPEVLLGGLLNVGAAGVFKGLGKLTGSMGKAIGGRVGEVAANDASAYENIVRGVQAGGGTSDEAMSAIKNIQAMAEHRAALPVEERKLYDPLVDSLIKQASKGDAALSRQLKTLAKNGSNTFDLLDKEIIGHAKVVDSAVTDIVSDLNTMERAQFGLKHKEMQRLADKSRMPLAADAANRWLDELEATIVRPDVPPAPNLKTITRRVAKEMPGAAPEAITAEGIARHAADQAAHEAEVAELFAAREAKVDPVIREMFGDPATRVGFASRDLSKLESMLQKTRREVKLAIREQDAGRLFAAMDDSKRIVGGMAKFGGKDLGVAQQFEQHIFETRLRPMLEDSNLWGQGLADLQKVNNEAFAGTMRAVNDFKRQFMSSTGLNTFAAKPGPMQTFVENLGHANNYEAERLVASLADAARGRSAAMLKTMDLPPNVAAAVERAGKRATELERELGKATVTASDARQIRELKAREVASGKSMTGQIGAYAGGAIGGALGGFVGGSAGAAAGGIMGKLMGFAAAPAKAMEAVGNFRRAEAGVRKWMSGESKDFLKGTKVPLVKPMLGEAERKAAMQSIEDLKVYGGDPQKLGARIQGMLGDMAETAPKMAAAITTTVARGMIALAIRAPQPLPARFTDKPGEQRYASGALEKFWHEKRLVESPTVIMQLMRSGQLHQEDLTLAKEVLPRLVAEMQSTLERDLMDAKARGGLRSMTYQEQLSLSWMLGRPLDVTQSPEFAMAMQASAANDPMNQAAFGKAAMGGGRPSKLDNINLERFETLQERLES